MKRVWNGWWVGVRVRGRAHPGLGGGDEHEEVLVQLAEAGVRFDLDSRERTGTREDKRSGRQSPGEPKGSGGGPRPNAARGRASAASAYCAGVRARRGCVPPQSPLGAGELTEAAECAGGVDGVEVADRAVDALRKGWEGGGGVGGGGMQGSGAPGRGCEGAKGEKGSRRRGEEGAHSELKDSVGARGLGDGDSELVRAGALAGTGAELLAPRRRLSPGWHPSRLPGCARQPISALLRRGELHDQPSGRSPLILSP